MALLHTLALHKDYHSNSGSLLTIFLTTHGLPHLAMLGSSTIISAMFLLAYEDTPILILSLRYSNIRFAKKLSKNISVKVITIDASAG